MSTDTQLDDIEDVLSSIELEELLFQLSNDDYENNHDHSLHEIVHEIESPFPCEIAEKDSRPTKEKKCSSICLLCNTIDLQNKSGLVKGNMGSMAQCRGLRGDELRQAGAISAILSILWRLMHPLQQLNLWIRKYIPGDEKRTKNYTPVLLLPPTASYTINNSVNLEYECEQHKRLKNDNYFSGGIALDALHLAALEFANVCMGALRDLSCGSSLSRAEILKWSPPCILNFQYQCKGQKCLQVKNGIHLLCAYTLRYHEMQWDKILSLREFSSNSTSNSTTLSPITERGKRELRLLTNTLGAIRNTSHSTPDNCEEFFECGLTDLLVWQLSQDLHNQSEKSNHTVAAESSIENTRYWREAKYRSAGSLINLAEKCPSVAYQLGADRQMILLLIETWGGANAVSSNLKKLKHIPLLHLGLAAILHAAEDGALDGGLDDVMKRILEKEKVRKKMAQEKEEKRKNKLHSHS